MSCRPVTPDGLILARPEGEVSALPVGRYLDLLVSRLTLLNAARLTPKGAEAGRAPVCAAKIGYFGRVLRA